jgi:predicted nucleic acid-binding protein
MAQDLPQIAARALVLDANIVLRAVLGLRVRSLIERYCDRVALLTPASCVAEVNEYLPELCRKRAWDVGPSLELLQSLLGTIQVVDLSLLGEYEIKARQRIARDPEDWPVVALALAVDSPVWTEDTDFFGAGVSTWTTDTVELYLSASED